MSIEKMLGYQNVLILDEDNFRNDIRDMLKAFGNDDIGTLVMQAVLLGVMYGKRIERQRRRKD